MNCIRYTTDDYDEIASKVTPLKEWLHFNVGPMIERSDSISHLEGSEFTQIAERFRAEYQLSDGSQLEEIMEIRGEGWMCYNTVEAIYAGSNFVDDYYGLYVFLPNETIAVQCKLAVL